jgi:hypothetical protein
MPTGAPLQNGLPSSCLQQNPVNAAICSVSEITKVASGGPAVEEITGTKVDSRQAAPTTANRIITMMSSRLIYV